jgi:hypothetical protein
MSTTDQILAAARRLFSCSSFYLESRCNEIQIHLIDQETNHLADALAAASGLRLRFAKAVTGRAAWDRWLVAPLTTDFAKVSADLTGAIAEHRQKLAVKRMAADIELFGFDTHAPL